MDKQYTITVEKAAEILEVSKKTIYRRLRDRKLKGKKIETKTGLKWFIDENDLEVAKAEKDVIDIVEIDNSVPIEELENKLQNMIQKAVQEGQEEVLEQNKELKKKVEKLEKMLHQILKNQQAGVLEKILKAFKK